MEFIISSPGYNSGIGGIIALHKLCHLLNETGHNAKLWLWNGNTNPKWNTPVTTHYEGQVCIYPEIVWDNPMNAKKIVRWCLNEPGKLGGPAVFPDEDIVFYFWPMYSKAGSGNILTVLEVQDIWQDQGNQRNGCCHIQHKGKEFSPPEGSEPLKTTGDYEYLFKMFNTKKYFVTSDDRTFTSLQAALCGCISVVQCEGNKQDWINKMAVNKYGIAWGWDDIPWAVQTMHLVRKNLADIQNETYNQIKKLVKACEL